jgi:hypothetical protein
VSESQDKGIIFRDDDGKEIATVKATDDGKVLVNEKEIKTVEEINLALNLIVRAINHLAP